MRTFCVDWLYIKSALSSKTSKARVHYKNKHQLKAIFSQRKESGGIKMPELQFFSHCSFVKKCAFDWYLPKNVFSTACFWCSWMFRIVTENIWGGASGHFSQYPFYSFQCLECEDGERPLSPCSFSREPECSDSAHQLHPFFLWILHFHF